MRLPPLHSSVQKRNGFTLIELLVVIAILILLMALTLGVMSKVYLFLDETKVTSDVTRLGESCNLFKSTFGRYPPARIILCEDGASYAGLIAGGGAIGQLAAYSTEYLSSIFPGIQFTFDALNPAKNKFDWNGDGNVPNGSWSLEGQECLVYFLGGMRPAGGTTVGFNTDKTRPTIITTGARLGPFFEFDASRLKPSANTGFQVYWDPYGTPYAYFMPRTPGMSNYFHPGAPQLAGATLAQQQFLSDCYTLTGNFVPYWKQAMPSVNPTAVSYQKGDTFQIVSAGKDKLFGCGGLWNQNDPEQSQFDFMVNSPTLMPLSGLASQADKQANYDNITNVTNGRVVPK